MTRIIEKGTLVRVVNVSKFDLSDRFIVDQGEVVTASESSVTFRCIETHETKWRPLIDDRGDHKIVVEVV